MAIYLTTCAASKYSECTGPIVADIVLQVKSGRKNVGRPEKLPLCLGHAVQGAVVSTLVNAGADVVWDLLRTIDPKMRKGRRLTQRFVVRDPWKSLLK